MNKFLLITSPTVAVDIVVEEASIVHALISPHKAPFTVLLSSLVHPLVSRSVRPSLDA